MRCNGCKKEIIVGETYHDTMYGPYCDTDKKCLKELIELVIGTDFDHPEVREKE